MFYKVRVCTGCDGVMSFAYRHYREEETQAWTTRWRTASCPAAPVFGLCPLCGTELLDKDDFWTDNVKKTVARWSWTFWPFTGKWTLKDQVEKNESGSVKIHYGEHIGLLDDTDNTVPRGYVGGISFTVFAPDLESEDDAPEVHTLLLDQFDAIALRDKLTRLLEVR